MPSCRSLDGFYKPNEQYFFADLSLVSNHSNMDRMMNLSLRKLLGLRASNSRRALKRPAARLLVESLEQRLALSTLHVGSDPGEYPMIQDAVNAANAGDTVRVDPGTYQEQVLISNAGHSRDNLRLIGSNQASIIQAPAAMTGVKAIVEVTGSQNVSIEDFTIQGPGGSICGSLRYGVRVDGGGSASITDNHITQIHDSPFGGCQNGVGILVGRNVEGQIGTAAISHNVIDDYQKGGIVVDNAGSSATIDHNTIVGVGPTALIGQNGIQISRGASAVASHNNVSANIYSPQTDSSTGFLLFNPGAVTLEHNKVSSNDVGIDVEGATGTIIVQNDVSGSTYDGIFLLSTSGARVIQNTTNNNGSGNPGDGGISLTTSTNNTLEQNTSKKNTGDGIFVDSTSTGNELTNNDLKGNTNFDAEDQSVGTGTAGTANTWTKNKGKTSSPSGIVS